MKQIFGNKIIEIVLPELFTEPVDKSVNNVESRVANCLKERLCLSLNKN